MLEACSKHNIDWDSEDWLREEARVVPLINAPGSHPNAPICPFCVQSLLTAVGEWAKASERSLNHDDRRLLDFLSHRHDANEPTR